MKRSLTGGLLFLTVVAQLTSAVPVWSQGLSPWGRHGEEGPQPIYPEVAVTAEWLARHSGEPDVVVIDARPESLYLSGHIPGAVSVPARSLPVVSSTKNVEGLLDRLGSAGLTGEGLLVCCGETSWSPEAGLLFWALELAGAERVAVLVDGLTGWIAARGSLTAEQPEQRARTPRAVWSRDPEPECLATLDHVRDSYGTEGVEIIDARGHYAWAGPVADDQWEDPPRAGHIPHALPFDFTSFFRPDGALREPAETHAEFAKLGPREANPVDLASEFIVYGTGSVSEGSLGYFLLRRAGIGHVRYYPGGWAEWSGDPILPVVRIIGADELMWRLGKRRRLFSSDAPVSGFAFFDVRHPADYARGHISGAVSLRSDHFADSLDFKLERYWPGLDRTKAPIVSYCYGEYCIRSRATSTAAARAGFLRVERFYGGLDEWQAAGGRLATSVWRG